MFKKAVILVSGNAFGSALLLLRNLLVARLVTPEDYGIASTFAIAMSIVEMMSYLGLNQMMVVDKDGDEPSFQAAMQGFQVMRGVLSSMLLFIIAHPYARFLGVEDVAWAYQIIAFIPLINGLQHFDIHRLKRHMKFTPSILATAVPALISVLSIWPLAWWLGDYRIMLAALIIQALTMVLISHLAAERPYQLRLDFPLMKNATIFGWPLLLNGILLFGVFNGERLIVGRELGMATLAIFSMAFTLTLTPTLVMAGSFQSFFLPQLTAARERPDQFQHLGIVVMEASLVIAVGLIVGTTLVAGPLVHALLGAKYEKILAILVAAAVLQAVRVSKTGAAVVALSKGLSGNAIAANSFRVLSIPVSWYVVIQTGSVMTVLLIGTIAELMGYALSLHLAAKRTGLKPRPLILPAALTGLLCVVAYVDALINPPRTTMLANLHWTLLGIVLIALAALLSMSGLRRYVLRRFG